MKQLQDEVVGGVGAGACARARMGVWVVVGLVAIAGWPLQAAAQMQGAAPPSDKATMERAQREADGPRRRILEAAKVKAVVRAEPALAPLPSPASALASAAALPTPVASPTPTAAPAEEPRALAVMLPSVAPVALPDASAVNLAASVVAPVQLAPATAAALAALPTAETLLPPKLLSKVEPELTPRLVRRLTRRVEMRVDLQIDTDGRVREASVDHGGQAAQAELAAAVREAMLQWRYEKQAAPRRHLVELVIDPV